MEQVHTAQARANESQHASKRIETLKSEIKDLTNCLEEKEAVLMMIRGKLEDSQEVCRGLKEENQQLSIKLKAAEVEAEKRRKGDEEVDRLKMLVAPGKLIRCP